MRKIFKIFQKKFGDLKIMLTFATPFEKRASEEEMTSSLKRLITVQEASTEKNTIYREALISFEIRSVRDKLRNI